MNGWATCRAATAAVAGAAAAVILAGFAPLARAQVPPGLHAKVTLVSELAAMPSSHALSLGVRFHVDPGWHIYWLNPGESGAPPRLTWSASSGVQIQNQAQWPVPERFTSFGSVGFGYEGDVMLIAMATRHASDAIGGSARIGLTVDYQICREVCVKESAKLSKTLTVVAGTPARSADAPLFDTARARLPQRLPRTWTTTATVTDSEITLAIVTGRRETRAEFFPALRGLLVDSAPERVEAGPTGMTLRLTRSSAVTEAPAQIRGVLVLADGAYQIAVTPTRR